METNPVCDRPQRKSVARADAVTRFSSQDVGMTITLPEVGDASAYSPQVVVVVVHRMMRQFIVELLNRDHDSWAVSSVDGLADLDATTLSRADLVIVDTSDFLAVRHHLPAPFSVSRVVVIGPEPDPAYRRASLDGGAGGWLSRDRIAEELCNALRSADARRTRTGRRMRR